MIISIENIIDECCSNSPRNFISKKISDTYASSKLNIASKLNLSERKTKLDKFNHSINQPNSNSIQQSNNKKIVIPNKLNIDSYKMYSPQIDKIKTNEEIFEEGKPIQFSPQL